MYNFEEEVQYFTELVYNNIQEAKKRKNKKALAEEAILNCINVSKDGQSIFVYNMDKDYCYELLKKDIEKYNYKNYRTKALALYYIGRLIEYLKKEMTFEELAGIYEETKPVVKNIIEQKNNISEQLRLLRKNRNIPEVQEYIDNLYNYKYASKYLKYLIDRYYYGKKNLIRPEKNGLEKIKEYSQSNINKIWQLLKKAFSIASSPSVRLIPFNIMNDENLKKPTSTKKTKKVYPLTQEEREKLEQILDNEERNHPYRNIVKIEWITSMRIGEVLARSKDDYNKDEKTLHIHNTVTKDKNGKLILGKYTKTYDKKTGIDKGERNFTVDEELEKLLDTLTTEEINNIYGLLFWNYEKNTFINPRRINDWLESINKKYKISDKKLHNHRLRHDRITQWKEAEMDISAIQYLAGHVEDSEVTDVYIDVSQDFAFEQLKKLKKAS